jgi:hypothetical protein
MGVVFLFTITSAIWTGTVPFYLITQTEYAANLTAIAMKAVRIA